MLKHARQQVWQRAALTIATGVLLAVECACGGGEKSPTTSTPSSPTPSSPNLTGTWNGSAGGGRVQITWRLTHQGDAVNGMSSFIDNSVSPQVTGEGRVTGTLSQSSFTFTDESPVGNVSVPGCPYRVTGTLTATSTSMSGSATGANCSGGISTSVSFTKQ